MKSWLKVGVLNLTYQKRFQVWDSFKETFGKMNIVTGIIVVGSAKLKRLFEGCMNNTVNKESLNIKKHYTKRAMVRPLNFALQVQRIIETWKDLKIIKSFVTCGKTTIDADTIYWLGEERVNQPKKPEYYKNNKVEALSLHQNWC